MMEYVTLLWKLFVEQWTNWFAWVQKDDNTGQLVWMLVWVNLVVWPLTVLLGRRRRRQLRDLREMLDEACTDADQAEAALVEARAEIDGVATKRLTVTFDVSDDFAALVRDIVASFHAKGFVVTPSEAPPASPTLGFMKPSPGNGV